MKICILKIIPKLKDFVLGNVATVIKIEIETGKM